MTDQDPKPFTNSSRVDWLPEEEVALERLRQILVGTYCTAKHDQGYLYVSEGVDFPLWMNVDRDRKLLHFFTHVEFVEQDTARQVECANELNADLVAVQFAAKDGHLWGNAWLPFNEGMSALHFVLMFRRFSSAFLHGTRHQSAKPLFTAAAVVRH